jgi:arylsulfatase A-like enzyme
MHCKPDYSHKKDYLLYLSLLIPVFTATFLMVSVLSGCKAKEKPNFLFILVDDLGWKDMGCYGSSFYETPRIDGLASRGVRFTDAYAASPLCSPTRSSILTGKNPARTHNTDWFGAPQPGEIKKASKNPALWMKEMPLLPPPYKEYLDLEEVTIAEALKEAGYSTFFAGKWHLGPTEDYWPENQGFDFNKGGWSRGAPFTKRNKETRTYLARGYFSPYGNPRLEDGPDGEHLPDRLAEETIKFIDSHRDKPFLAYLSFYSVHTPLMARKDLKQKYQQKKEKLGLEDEFGMEGDRRIRLTQSLPAFAAMVEAMDEAVGKVLDKLESEGLQENTIVIFMSDNGGFSTPNAPHNRGGCPTCNLPLRAGKSYLYEGGIRVPMIIRWPGVADPGTVCGVPVTSTDFYPTMLEMAGLPLRPQQHLDGISLVSLLRKGEVPERDAIHFHFPHYGNEGGRPGTAIRQGRYKLIRFYEGERTELYDLSTDLEEAHDISDKKPEIRDELLDKLNAWLGETGAGIPSVNESSNHVKP